jgi:hypothetical protein
MALTDQNFRVRRTTIRQSGEVEKFEADFHIEGKEGAPTPFTLDDLIAGLNNLKTAQSVPGTALVGSAVEFALRWE